ARAVFRLEFVEFAVAHRLYLTFRKCGQTGDRSRSEPSEVPPGLCPRSSQYRNKTAGKAIDIVIAVCVRKTHIPEPPSMASRLPPLNPLRAFEATARRGAVSAAARELNVTHGAVSHQIRALEESLGTALFERGGK